MPHPDFMSEELSDAPGPFVERNYPDRTSEFSIIFIKLASTTPVNTKQARRIGGRLQTELAPNKHNKKSINDHNNNNNNKTSNKTTNTNTLHPTIK